MSLFSLVWSNMFRRKVRTFLTLFSILIAFLLFALLRTITIAFDGDIRVEGADRLVVGPKYSMIDLLPVSHMAEMYNVDGVELVVHSTFFGGKYAGLDDFFFKFPVQPKDYFEMYSEYVIDPEQLDAFQRTRTGAVAPRALAEKYGWEIGDNIPIEGDIWLQANGQPWIFEFMGVYDLRNGEETIITDPFMIHYDYFDEAREEENQGIVSTFAVKISDPEDAPSISAEIDALFENSSNPTRTATEAEQGRQMLQQIGNIGLMMTGILSAVFFTILLLTANTMTQAFRERITELAVLKAFGFTDMTVSMLVLAESVTLCVVGGTLGIGLAIVIVAGIGPQIESFLGSFQLPAEAVISGFLVAIALGLVVGLVPAITAKRLQIVDALRK